MELVGDEDIEAGIYSIKIHDWYADKAEKLKQYLTTEYIAQGEILKGKVVIYHRSKSKIL